MQYLLFHRQACTRKSLGLFHLSKWEKMGAGCLSRVAQMDKKCRICWDQCFSHSFYLVLLENGQKSAGKGHLTPPFWPPFIWPIYKGNEAWKWHFLTNLKFDHPNDPKLIRKHWETLGHTQIPPPGPKEQQNWALWWNSSPLNAPQVHVYPRCK